MVTKAFSIEDGNLQTAALITSRGRSYSDIDLTFTAKGDGDVYKKTDAAAVKQSVKNLLMTGRNEKPFNDEFGGGLGNMLFELVDEESQNDIEEAIQSSIDIFEPRALLQDLDVNVFPDGNRIGVKIIFRVVNTQEVVVLDTTLSRIR